MTQPSAKVVENRSSRQLTRTALNYRDKHHVNGARKIRTLLTSQLTKEIVSLEDDLIKKGELANALVAKVEALEHDKHVVTVAFERATTEMQAILDDIKNRYVALHIDINPL